MFQYADVDGDGKLSFKEFLNIVSPSFQECTVENAKTKLNDEDNDDDEGKTVKFKEETERSRDAVDD